MGTVIKVENLSKQYRLGTIGTGSLAHDINRWWHVVRGKDNPYLRIGEQSDNIVKGKSEYVWALQDINFEIKQGEVVGIIGRNGAGKSTLLKILSRTTSPTTGKVKIKGRVASLLEVGTGFHPELTGRENVFLNGAIMGMTRREIKQKFDEIVDFAGVDHYIDTPVKRYSSGMYVRLAFGVAAHLEPEILIVDEVLAVGDAEFQKKALGKMKDVSNKEGRTVLFVSHNMSAIQKLCKNGILLDKGRLVSNGAINNVLNLYVQQSGKTMAEYSFEDSLQQNQIAKVTKIRIEDLNGNPLPEIAIGKPWRVKVFIRIGSSIKNLIIGLGMLDSLEGAVRTSWNLPINATPGNYVATFMEDEIFFSTGRYRILIGLSAGLLSLQYLDDNIYVFFSDVVESQQESVIRTDNGILLNQMKMHVEKID